MHNAHDLFRSTLAIKFDRIIIFELWTEFLHYFLRSNRWYLRVWQLHFCRAVCKQLHRERADREGLGRLQSAAAAAATDQQLRSTASLPLFPSILLFSALRINAIMSVIDPNAFAAADDLNFFLSAKTFKSSAQLTKKTIIFRIKRFKKLGNEHRIWWSLSIVIFLIWFIKFSFSEATLDEIKREEDEDRRFRPKIFSCWAHAGIQNELKLAEISYQCFS